jgi:hypothetical protein
LYKFNGVNFRQLWPTGLPLSLEAHVNFYVYFMKYQHNKCQEFYETKTWKHHRKMKLKKKFFVMYVLSTMELFFKKLIKSDLKVVLQNRMLLQSFPLSLYKCSHSSNTTSSKMCLKVTTYVLKQLHTNKKAPC